MIRLICCLFFVLLPLSAQNRKISLRGLCICHAQNVREIFVVSGSVKAPVFTKVPLYTSAYSDAIELTVSNNMLSVALPTQVTKKHPHGYRVIATKKLASGRRQLAVFIPTTKKETPYRLTLIPEGEKVFPMGSTLIYNLSSTDLRMTLGEHTRQIAPNQRAQVPIPKKVNALNQTTVRTFLKSKEGKWITVSSTVWKTSPKLRGFAVAYIHPRSKRPVVDCFQETPPWRLPQLE